MVNIPVKKWRVEGNETLFDTLSDAIKDQPVGTLIHQIYVIEEVPDPENRNDNNN